MKRAVTPFEVGLDQPVDAAELVVDLLEAWAAGQCAGRRLEDLDQDRHDDHQHRHGDQHLDQGHAAPAGDWHRWCSIDRFTVEWLRWVTARVGVPACRDRIGTVGEHPSTGGRSHSPVKMVCGITLTTLGMIRAALSTAGVPAAVSSVRDCQRLVDIDDHRAIGLAESSGSAVGRRDLLNLVPVAALGGQVVPFAVVDGLAIPGRELVLTLPPPRLHGRLVALVGDVGDPVADLDHGVGLSVAYQRSRTVRSAPAA